LQLQAKLLRVLEDKRVRPLGATEEAAIDVRFVSASNVNVEKAIGEGNFRSDLYYRIATVTISVPPLRERPEDLEALIKHFMARAGAEAGRRPPEIAPEAMTLLRRYLWPGNIRELQNVVQRAVIVCQHDRIEPMDFPPGLTGEIQPPLKFEEPFSLGMTLEQLEREYVRAVLALVGGNKSEAANILGIDRKTLYRKLDEIRQSHDQPVTPRSDPSLFRRN
jgi:DNA-binding NtrC family response regulator